MSYSPTHLQTQNFQDYLIRHREWSYHTFGSPEDGRGPAGPHAHIAKELDEIRAAPDDLEEWIDVIILSIDGAFRSGAAVRDVAAFLGGPFVAGNFPNSNLMAVQEWHSSMLEGSKIKQSFCWLRLVVKAIGAFLSYGGEIEGVLPMLFKKQAKNFARDWPDWRQFKPGEAIEHVRTEAEKKAKEAELEQDPPPNFTGFIIGGPLAGQSRSHNAPYFRVRENPPTPVRPYTAEEISTAMETDIKTHEYRHVIGINFGPHNRVDFWMLMEDVRAAEKRGLNPANYAMGALMEDYSKYHDLRNS